MAARHDALVTLEENAIMGGAGGGVNGANGPSIISLPVLNIGLPDFFFGRKERREEPARMNWGSTLQALKPKSRHGWHNPPLCSCYA